MPRWKPDAITRLEAAAIELFDEQGFERTTVAEITHRAGLTQRTFYNHFADKREVLFSLALQFQQEVVQGITGGAGTANPLDIAVSALQSAADKLFEERRATVMRRQRVVDANPELREREFSKRVALTDAIAATLHARGFDAETSLLAAGASMLVQHVALQQWTQPSETRALQELLADTLHSLTTAIGQTQ